MTSDRMRILLVSMPYGSLNRPSLGISLLKSILTDKGYHCDIRYLTFDFAARIGYGVYEYLHSQLPYTAFAGDWTFEHLLNGYDPARASQYAEEILSKRWQLSAEDIDRVFAVKGETKGFIEQCIERYDWKSYDVIGFTSTFEQNLASLAMAQAVKAHHPAARIIFGGANWEGEMGQTLHTHYPFVDVVFSGEADKSLPAWVDQLHGNGSTEPVEGIIYRDATGASIYTGPAPLLREMDELPYPDYAAYFDQRNGHPLQAVPHLLMETSRGCWWGAKSHCTFCGLNGNSMSFRGKSPDRALAEMLYLSDKWDINFLEIVDNILEMNYFKNLLPALANLDKPLKLFYEVKANLSREQVSMLKQAGVHTIQPGIESMSNHVLKLMRKGTSALINVHLLKLCKEYGVKAEWNVLYGFPGEQKADYDEMKQLFDSIKFLDPPSGLGPIRLDRFSPYFSDPEGFGLKELVPMESYEHLYQLPVSEISKIAYYFNFSYEEEVDPNECYRELVKYVEDWKADHGKANLKYIRRSDERLSVIDERVDQEYILEPVDSLIYEYCDAPKSLSSVMKFLGAELQDPPSEEEVQAFLSNLIDLRLMINDDDKYMSLAIREHHPELYYNLEMIKLD